jgi:flagellar biosynthesis protein FlhA
VDVLTEYVRNGLRRTICTQYAESEASSGVSRLYCVTLDPAVEDLINGYIDRSASGTSMTMPPTVANRVNTALLAELQKLIAAGHHPLVLASPQVRAAVRKLLEPYLPNAAVLGYNEITKGVEVESMGLVQLEQEAQAPVG